MKWLHNLLKGLSLTACLFVFQACYGTPEPPYEPDIDMGDNPAPVLVTEPQADTPEALPEILDALTREGYQIVPVSRLLLQGDCFIDSTGRQCRK